MGPRSPYRAASSAHSIDTSDKIHVKLGDNAPISPALCNHNTMAAAADLRSLIITDVAIYEHNCGVQKFLSPGRNAANRRHYRCCYARTARCHARSVVMATVSFHRDHYSVIRDSDMRTSGTCCCNITRVAWHLITFVITRHNLSTFHWLQLIDRRNVVEMQPLTPMSLNCLSISSEQYANWYSKLNTTSNITRRRQSH
jgi:hypothetical protein